MSRTYRRRRKRHEYSRVLRDWVFDAGYPKPVFIEFHSREGRREITRFHSDAYRPTFKGGVPHWFRRVFKKRQRMSNTQQLMRWMDDPAYEPVMDVRHRHSARWAWW